MRVKLTELCFLQVADLTFFIQFNSVSHMVRHLVAMIQVVMAVKAIAPTDFGAPRALLAIVPKSVGAPRADLAITPKWSGGPMTGSGGGSRDWRAL